MNRIFSSIASAGLVLFLPAMAGAADCKPWYDADLAFKDRSLFNAVAAHDAAARTTGCTALDKVQIARWTATLYQAEAHRVSNGFTAAFADARSLLEKGSTFALPWLLSASMGQLALAEANALPSHRKQARAEHFAEAARHLQLALLDINDLSDPSSKLLDPRPNAATVGLIAKAAEEARLLAPGFVTVPGRPACRMGPSDGFVTQVASLPIRFVTNETAFTDTGFEAALELSNCLSGLRPDEVVQVAVIGHADERGPDDHNLWLSRERAAAVVDYLKQRGIRHHLIAEGRGEREPYQTGDPGQYSQEELWQLDRRVEIDVTYRKN